MGRSADRSRIVQGFGVDTRELSEFATRLRKSEPELNRKLRRNLREAAKLISDDAQEIIDEAATSVKVKPRTARASVWVEGSSQGPDGTATPLARLLEKGNADGRDRGGTFRHPVFGRPDIPWQPQDMHPYERPAAEKRGPEALELVQKALKEAVEEAGFSDA